MSEKVRIAVKVGLVILSTMCLIYLIHKDATVFSLKQPQGDRMIIKDVIILVDALVGEQGGETEKVLCNYEEQYLNYGSYLKLLETLDVVDREELLYQEKYQDSFFLLKEDWYRAYDKMIEIFGMEDDIICKEISVLSQVISEEKEDRILTADGSVYPYSSQAFQECKFQNVWAYMTKDRLLTLKEVKKENFVLENVWIMEKGQESLQIFTMGYEMVCPFRENEFEVSRESVADITFSDGMILSVKCKTEKISGKLLRISASELEIEGKGSFPIHHSCKIYQLYDKLRELEHSAMLLGTDFADYVICDGEICSILVMRKDSMESIRVAIKSDDFSSLYHKEITIKPDCDAELIYGPYKERLTKFIHAGEEITFNKNCEYLSGDTILLKPLALSGKTKVLSLTRNQGTACYRGNLQIANSKEGLVLINEVLLEEYLYSVVPSEMPASYPREALKAQAICARTYAYRYMETPGLGEIGAHVDDSVGYQVYNHIAENANSTKAVKETAGMLVYYGKAPAETYYYSTSCGFGTDTKIWHSNTASDDAYLTSLHINRQCDRDGNRKEIPYTGQMMQQEDRIKEYLFSVNEDDYESKEAWYRWSYQVEEIDAEKIHERLCNRFQADKTKILKLAEHDNCEEDGVFESIEPVAFNEIYRIKCEKRKSGGIVDELIIETEKGTYKVISEYNIRYVLNQGGEILRQDGNRVTAGQLLPSAYIIVDEKRNNHLVTGYEIVGGGYGHGVGMSQNGAKNMAEEGKSCEDIIHYFYQGCEIKRIY